MDETMKELRKCLDNADEMENHNWEALHALPDYDELDKKRCELEYYFDYAKRCGRDSDDEEKELNDFMDAHADYKQLMAERSSLKLYIDDIWRKISSLGYEWDADKQDFVRKAA